MAALTKIRSCRSQAEYLQQNAGLSVGGAHVLNPGQPEPSIKPIRIQDLGPGFRAWMSGVGKPKTKFPSKDQIPIAVRSIAAHQAPLFCDGLAQDQEGVVLLVSHCVGVETDWAGSLRASRNSSDSGSYRHLASNSTCNPSETKRSS